MANWITAAEAIALTGNTSITEGNVSLAQAVVTNFIGREITVETSRTEYYSGANTPNLPLRVYPVASVTSVYLDSQGYYGQNADGFLSNTLLTAGVNYDLVRQGSTTVGQEGLLRFLLNGQAYGWSSGYAPYGYWGGGPLSRLGKSTQFGWPTGAGNIKVTYVGGYSAIPDDLKAAVALQAAFEQKTAKNGGAYIATSGSLGPASYGLGAVSSGTGTTLSPGNAMLGSVAQILAKYKPIYLGIPI